MSVWSVLSHWLAHVSALSFHLHLHPSLLGQTRHCCCLFFSFFSVDVTFVIFFSTLAPNPILCSAVFSWSSKTTRLVWLADWHQLHCSGSLLIALSVPLIWRLLDLPSSSSPCNWPPNCTLCAIALVFLLAAARLALLCWLPLLWLLLLFSAYDVNATDAVEISSLFTRRFGFPQKSALHLFLHYSLPLL